MIRSIIIGTSLAIAVPAAAQTQPATEQAKPDPARHAVAKRVVDNLWPMGTYRRMMDGTMSKMMSSMMDSMFDMKASDMEGMMDPSGKKTSKTGDQSLGQVAEAADPHFRERFRITMDTMMGEMIPLFEKFEPAIRDSLSNIYARDFTAEQLTDMDAFFQTPTGKVYGKHWMMTFVDPEMIKNMQAFTPELMKSMPTIMKKVEKATAHLPPVKKAEPEGVPPTVTTEQYDPDDEYSLRNEWSEEDEAAYGKFDTEAAAASSRATAFAREANERARAKAKKKDAEAK